MSSFLIVPYGWIYDMQSQWPRKGEGRDGSSSGRGKASSGSCEACGS